ncbi:MAG TPA: biotin transporter BioY [Gemmatimonadales bacterium]|nr:biotin transporter BioY [Gemmatimonadales bacterium]
MTSPAVRRPSMPVSAPRRSRVPLAWPVTLAAGATVVALSAQVAIPVPFSPVPMTLQPLAVLLVGGLFGAAAGAGALGLYLVAGAFGEPVFAPIGPQGLARLFGPTGGYLLAMPLAAVVVGRLAERGRLFQSLLAAALGMLVIHLGGWAQLAVLTGSPARALQFGTLPFVAQDLLKVALAGLVLWRGHHALRLRA